MQPSQYYDDPRTRNPEDGGLETYWQVNGTTEEVYDILSDPTDFARWWPAGYREVTELDDDNESVYEVTPKGGPPHTYKLKTTEKTPLRRIEREIRGDLVGRSVWTIEEDPDEPWSHILHRWLVRANTPVLKAFFWVAKSRYKAIYQQTMEKGKESLQSELNH